MTPDDARNLARMHNRAEWQASGLRLFLAAVSLGLMAAGLIAGAAFVVMMLGGFP